MKLGSFLVKYGFQAAVATTTSSNPLYTGLMSIFVSILIELFKNQRMRERIYPIFGFILAELFLLFYLIIKNILIISFNIIKALTYHTIIKIPSFTKSTFEKGNYFYCLIEFKTILIRINNASKN